MMIRTMAALGAAFLIGAPAAGAFNPQPEPPAFAQLVADIQALPAVQNPQPLLAKATAAREAADRGQPCAAVNVVGALRNQVAAKTGKKSVPDEAWQTIDVDSVRVLVALLQSPGSEACGGALVPAVQTEAPEVDVVASDTTGITLHVGLPQPTLTARTGNGVVYADLGMDGLGSPGSVGSPNVPALTQYFALPQGADGSVRLLGSTGYDVPGVRLWPQQDEAADGSEFAAPPFAIDLQAYSRNAPYPASPAREAALGTLRDVSAGGVEIDGGQYNPVSQALHVYTSLDLRIDFGGGTGVFADQRATSLWNLSYQRLYRSALLNWDAVIHSVGVNPSLHFCGAEYLIVTTHELLPAAQTLATARSGDGISTEIVTLGTGRSDIGTTKEQIQQYIRSTLDGSCLIRPSYVGILGDTSQVPTWHPASPWSGTGFDNTIASDLPYALADDADLLPDLAIGRMPAPSLAVANQVVGKIVAYEDGPPLFPADFYRHATVTSYFQCGLDSGGQPCNPGTQDERTFTKLSEQAHALLAGHGYTVDRVYTTTAISPQKFYDGTPLPPELLRPGFAWNGSTADVVNDWNAGRFLILHRDHGAPNGWANPGFDTGTIGSLTNGALEPVVLSINCASGKFDDPGSPNFAEQLLEKPDGGAVGVIGDSRNSPSNTNSHLAFGLMFAMFPVGFGSYHPTPILRMGDVLVSGKLYMNTQNGIDGQDDPTTRAELYLYHWFGDPTMPIWTHRPAFFLTEAKSVRLVNASLVVSIADPNADGAVATVFANGEAIGRGFVENGVATIVPDGPLPPPGAEQGGLVATVDKDGYVPAQIVGSPTIR